jgi:predicted hotdog family 3-hydroxylacyl-ACP dehydratase
MVDALVACDDISSHTTLLVKQGNILVDDNSLTEAGLIENIAQTTAAGVGYTTQKKGLPVVIGYIGAVKNLEVFALPKVGDTIETEVIIDRQIFEVTIVNGYIKCKGELLANCEMKIFIKN